MPFTKSLPVMPPTGSLAIKDRVKTPILTITNEGVFLWAADAAARIETDDFHNCEANRHILRALWRLKCLEESLND